jgi:hypothetical protein
MPGAENDMELLSHLAVSVVGGAIAALLTMWLALKRYYREKWWERKMAAYVAVIEALHHVQRDLDAEYKEEVEGARFNEQHRDGLRQKATTGWTDLRRNADVGEFLFSEETTKALQTFLGKVDGVGHDPSSTNLDYVETGIVGIEELLPRIKRLARRDLGLSPLKADS